MNKQQAKRAGLKRRERRVRSKICGTASGHGTTAGRGTKGPVSYTHLTLPTN